MPVLLGWIVVSEATEMQNGKKNTTYTWNARTPCDCIADLVTLS